jgi:hypothetical protein
MINLIEDGVTGEKNRLREKGFLFKITLGCRPSRPHQAGRQIV